jgi:N-methylhydantoinase A/oxoprolinase/acetone carboxylase beta subunit
MDGVKLLAKAKLSTTPDVTEGIVAALRDVLAQRPPHGSIDGVMVGTTHFTNALLERRNLTPTAVIRLSLPATKLLPPLVDWPGPLREAIGGFT